MSLQFYWSVIPIENILPSHAHLIHIPYRHQISESRVCDSWKHKWFSMFYNYFGTIL